MGKSIKFIADVSSLFLYFSNFIDVYQRAHCRSGPRSDFRVDLKKRLFFLTFSDMLKFIKANSSYMKYIF